MRRACRAYLLIPLLARAALADDPTPLGEAECIAFAKAMEKEVAALDGAATLRRFDWAALLDRVTAGYDPNTDFVRKFRSGFLASRGEAGMEVPVIIDNVRNGGSYTLLRIHERDGAKRALFRLLMPGRGVGYHDCVLARGKDGQPTIVDIDVLAAGETLSAQFRTLFLAAAAEESKGFMEKLLTSESDLAKHYGDIKTMQRLTREGRPDEALRVYRSLPASLRQSKMVLLHRLRAAQALGPGDEYATALADLRARYPNDPCTDLLSVDDCLLRKRYDEALAGVDRLDKAVGGDPYNDVLRGNIHYMKGDRDAAIRCLNRAIAAEPTLEDPYWSLVQLSLDEKKFDETARLLSRIEKTLGLKLGDLTDIDAYAEFVKSAEYRKWLGRGK
jgi:hypothetical protein